MHGGHHHHDDHDHAAAFGHGGRLKAAIVINLLLTLVEVAGGVYSHSLGLFSDALHNFGDVGTLIIALVAYRISQRPADALRTFGYRRAETIGALINLAVLVVSGVYLLAEAGLRSLHPEPVEGGTVIWIASLAVIVNLGTVALTFAMAKGNLNMRAAFLHNLSDAIASVGVIISGFLVMKFGWLQADTIISAVIAGYIIWQGISLLPETIHILMEGAPPHLTPDDVMLAMNAVPGVDETRHLHLWQLDEKHSALEAHIVVANLSGIEPIRAALKNMLGSRFGIEHSTLEFETAETPNTHHLRHSPV